jgi:hypothetical protein
MSSRRRGNTSRGLSARQELMRLLTVRNVRYHLGVPRNLPDPTRPITMKVPSTTNRYTMSGGNLTSTLSLTPSTWVSNFNSTWAAVFDQYVVLKATVSIKINQVGTSAGEIWVRVGEATSVSSTMTQTDRMSLQLVSPSDDLARTGTIVWEPASSEDMQWKATTVAQDFAFLQIYSNTAVTGTSSGDSTSSVIVNVYFELGLRYFKG